MQARLYDARKQQGRHYQEHDRPIHNDRERDKLRPMLYQGRGEFRHYGHLGFQAVL